MRLPRTLPAALAVAAVLGLPSAGPAQPSQPDTFQGGTTMGWMMPNALQNLTVPTDGGPAGTGDRFLRVESTGTGTAGARPVFVNRAQWLGNYNTAGVSVIEMDLFNFTTQALSIRIAFKEGTSSAAGGYVSQAFPLPVGTQWQHAVFPLTAGSMTSVGATQTLTQVLSAPVEVRILHGDTPLLVPPPLAVTLGVDNIRAVPEPTGVLAVVLAAAGGVAGPRLLRRRRAEAVTPDSGGQP
jgi:hypothetical protein